MTTKRIRSFQTRVARIMGESRPVSMQLEITNACNFRCLMCPFHGPEKASNRPIGCLQVADYRSLLEQFREMGGTFLIPQGAGESFLHPDIGEMLTIATADMDLDVGLNTNGSHMSDEIIRTILDCGVKEIGFSIDALDPETFHRITGGDLAQVEEGIDLLIARRRERRQRLPLIRVLIVEQAENREEIPEFVSRWISRVDEVVVQALRVEAGRTLGERRKEKRRPCRHLIDTIFVQWDGQMVVCCEDWESVTGVGNVFESSLRELWLGPVMNAYRDAQRRGIWAPPEICRRCDAWAGGVETTIDFGDRVQTASALTRVWRRK
ncbi:radical SAM protein [bacterium]|nr:radical SAM protein [candidate division CSSED10-310 bacterium]